MKLNLPSVLWHCWLGGRKDIQPVKTEWWGAGMVISLERDADLHMAQRMPLPLTVSCSSKIQIRFTFLVPAHPGSPGERAIKHECVCIQMKLNQLVQGKLATFFYKGSANTISILKLFKFQDESGLSFSPSVSSTTCSRTDTMGIVVQVFHQTNDLPVM